MASQIEQAWEFDAPQWYDFQAGSPATGPSPSAWFTEQGKGLRSPLAEVQQKPKNVDAGVQQQQQGVASTPKSAVKPTSNALHAPSEAPKTVPSTQPKNVVTSWMDYRGQGKADTSMKKKQERSLPPKSASKKAAPSPVAAPVPAQAQAPPVVQQQEVAVAAKDVKQIETAPAQQAAAGAQEDEEEEERFYSPDAGADYVSPANHMHNHNPLFEDQHNPLFEPRMTRSASKAQDESPCIAVQPVQAAAPSNNNNNATTTNSSLRSAMAKARITRTAKSTAAAAATTAAPTPAPAAAPASTHKPVPTTGRAATRPTAASLARAKPRHAAPASAAKAEGIALRPRFTTSMGRGGVTKSVSKARVTPARGVGAARATPAAGGVNGSAQKAGVSKEPAASEAPATQQAQANRGPRAVPSSAPARPTASRTHASFRNKRANADEDANASAATNPLLRVAKGSGVNKVKASGGAQGGPGSSRKTDPVKLKKMLQTRRVMPVRSTKPLTLPEEPQLGMKRSHPSPQEPEEGQKTPFKPLALRVKEFQTHTRTPATKKAKPTPAAEAHKPAPRTQAKEPTFRTSARLRSSHIKSRDEQEAELMASMPKFQARPLNPHILEAPRSISAAPGSARHAPTQAQPFNFITDDRLQRRHQQQQQQQQQEESFKAMPLNRALLDHPVGLPKKPRMSLTVPKSPMLRTRSRTSAMQASKKEEELNTSSFKARPVPAFLQVPREFLSTGPREHAPTQPTPFELRTDQRGKKHRSRLQAKLSELEQEQEALRNYKAHQVPSTLERPAVPHKPDPKPLTAPHPFNLRSEVRHETYVAEFTSHLSEEERQKQAEAEFKARAMWQGMPFKPHESDAPLTAPSEPCLATIARANERHAFDQQVEERWKAIEEEKAAAIEAARKAEEEEVQEYRRTLRFKAKPLPKHMAHKSSAPASGSKPVTRAKTPQLGNKRKAGE